MLWPALAIVSLILLAAAAGGCVWLLAERRALRADRDRVGNDLAQREAAIEGYLDQVEQLQTTLNEKQNLLTEQRAKLEGLDDKFKALANDVLKQSSEQFLQLAKKTFDGEQKDAAAQLEQRKQAIESLIKPIRESLDKHAKAVTDIEKTREGAYHGLRQQLVSMIEDQKTLRCETANLVTALRRPDVRGRWGEVQLKRVAELAGMVENCDFTDQGVLADGLRPDMRVCLPGGREIVVDAKTPIDAFLASVEAKTDADRDRELDRHVRHITDKIADLSSKRYQDQVRSADFVVLFIPGESFLYAAASRRADLIEYAMTKGVVIATPTTLVALLKAVALGWREEKIAENARKISDLGKELHERIAVALGHAERLGRSLEASVKSYNQFVGSFETRIVSSARKFKELGADSSKELPADPTPQIEIVPREVKQTASAD
jgi:DNA recombination protein RmuC